jgi:hypothetical protein
MGLSKLQQLELVRLFLARKEDLDDLTVEDWFSEGFLTTNFYTFWRTMFAFQNWHSVLEMKLYMHRFLHLMDGLNDMTALVFPKYNQYDSFIVPLMAWLKDRGGKGPIRHGRDGRRDGQRRRRRNPDHNGNQVPHQQRRKDDNSWCEGSGLRDHRVHR